MRNVTDTCCKENQNTRYMLNDIFYENHVVCETMWENAVQPNRPQMIMWCMHFACWISKATETHLKYVITCCFFLATVVMRTHLSLTLCIHCPSCFYIYFFTSMTKAGLYYLEELNLDFLCVFKKYVCIISDVSDF